MPTFHSDAFVFFGATGDLAYKQIFPALIGVAGRPWASDQLRARARSSLEEHGGVDPDAFAKLSARLKYISGDYGKEETYEHLRKALGGAARPG